MSTLVEVETGSHVYGTRPLVALAGNPNTGKSTLFNRWTGSQSRVGNYPGVTVDLMRGEARLADHDVVDIIDIPGTYSLLARSAEELLAVDHLLGLSGHRRPDVVVVCVDATNLLRNLYLVLQMQELALNVVVALTMVDELDDASLHLGELSARIGCPVVPVSVPRGRGLSELGEAVDRALASAEGSERFVWEPTDSLAADIAMVRKALPSAWPATRGLALWALMSWDDEAETVPPGLRDTLAKTHVPGTEVDDEVIGARYAFLDRELGQLVAHPPDRTKTRAIDRVLIHPIYGFGVFVATMLVLFQALFAWADPAIALIEDFFAATAHVLAARLPESAWSELLVEGVIGGVGSVVVFLPQILMLFFMIGLMEDSGYMARVAYLMDRIMRALGLHGRAFVPMLSGFACAIPAIMATRTMERRRDRILTMMVVPLMTCSARLPVYTLLIAALFPATALLGVLPVQGLLMVAMYGFSVMMALASAFVLSKTVLPAPPTPLLLELPPYRLPRLRDVARMMWTRTRFFLTDAGGVILVCSLILWVLLSFPRTEPLSRDYDSAIEQAATAEQRSELAAERAGERLRSSYAGRLGHVLEPIVAPLGFDWKIGVGLIGAFAAREVFVATMGVVYSAGDDVDEESATLRERMRAARRADGRPVYTPLTGLSLMVFFALACQCMSTLAVVKRETNGFRWPLFLFAYMTLLAWVCSFLVYKGGRVLGFG